MKVLAALREFAYGDIKRFMSRDPRDDQERDTMTGSFKVGFLFGSVGMLLLLVIA
jgi:hypothetical protein